MKRLTRTVVMSAVLLSAACPCGAQQNLTFAQAQAQVLAQAAEIKQEAAQAGQLLDKEKADLTRLRKEIKDRVTGLEGELTRLQERFQANLELERQKREELAEGEAQAKNLEAAVRLSAKEAERLLSRSLVTAEQSERLEGLAPLKDQRRFPALEDIQVLAGALFSEMEGNGRVVSREGSFVDRRGREAKARLLRAGNFTAYYQAGEEEGFLQPGSRPGQLQAVASDPPYLTAREIRQYLAGESPDLPLDPSGGTALSQLKTGRTVTEWIAAGGLLAWPIIGLAAVALLLILERLISLGSVRTVPQKFMAVLREQAAKGRWADCLKACQSRKRTPACRVLEAGLEKHKNGREEMEAAVDEAVLKELPRLERFLPTLSILAVISPLLGLLGTVTGMINTFQVITRFGASDPRLMAGGISEALITTQLGLAVAVPIIIIHHLFERRVDKIAGDMEEKGLSLTALAAGQGAPKEAGA